MKLEAWYDFACASSARSFLALTEEVLPSYLRTGRVQFLHYQYPQPWHAPGAYAAEVSLAVELVDPEAYFTTCKRFFEKQEDLVFDIVSYDMTRAEMYGLLASAAHEASGVDAQAVLERVRFLGTSSNAGNAVGQLLRQYSQHGRNHRIHATPTVLVNGIEVPSDSSGWTRQAWSDYLDKRLAALAEPGHSAVAPSKRPSAAPAPLPTSNTLSLTPVLPETRAGSDSEATVASLDAELQALQAEGLQVRVLLAEAQNKASTSAAGLRQQMRQMLEQRLFAEGYNALVARRVAARAESDDFLAAKREVCVEVAQSRPGRASPSVVLRTPTVLTTLQRTQTPSIAIASSRLRQADRMDIQFDWPDRQQAEAPSAPAAPTAQVQQAAEASEVARLEAELERLREEGLRVRALLAEAQAPPPLQARAMACEMHPAVCLLSLQSQTVLRRAPRRSVPCRESDWQSEALRLGHLKARIDRCAHTRDTQIDAAVAS